MIGAVVGLALLALAHGPNGQILAGGVAEIDSLERKLVPWSALVRDLGPLWIEAEHDDAHRRRPGGVPATFVGGRSPWVALFPAEVVDRARPELWLHAERYLGGARGPRWSWRLVPLETLAVDDADALLRALLEARFARLFSHRGSPRQEISVREVDARTESVARARAAEMWTEVPADQRLQTHLGALVDFGAAAMAIAHEIGRHARRGAPGRLCAALDSPATLFGHWRRTWERSGFAGQFRRPDVDPRQDRSWALTRQTLEPADKAWLFDAVLGRPFTGDPRRDFGFLCDAE